MSLLDDFSAATGRLIARLITRQSLAYQPFQPSDPAALRAILRPGDVLLVEGNQRVSTAIKYLTQSTWSHAALFVGDALGAGEADNFMLVEVTLLEGCIATPLASYDKYTTRVCRPIGLSDEDRQRILRFMIDRIGLRYDLRNVFDLIRYMHPTPLVPVRWRRRMIALGSGQPTRAICSTLIAEAFQTAHYPILPLIDEAQDRAAPVSPQTRGEIMHIRHHSLYAPRDFDMSPYFQIIKPTLETGFDYKQIVWDDAQSRTLPRTDPVRAPPPPEGAGIPAAGVTVDSGGSIDY